MKMFLAMLFLVSSVAMAADGATGEKTDTACDKVAGNAQKPAEASAPACVPDAAKGITCPKPVDGAVQQ